VKEQIRKAIFKDYIEEYSAIRGLRRETVRGKRDTLKRFIKWLEDKPFNAKSCCEWLKHLSDKGWKPVSIKHEVRILRATVKFLYSRDFIKEDFSLQIPYPKIHKKPLEIVPAELAEKIIIAGTKVGPGDNCINIKRKKEYRQALRFILRTGLRNRELRDLKGKDINLEEETFFVRSKSGNIDVLPIPRDMLNELRKRKNKVQLFKVTAKTLNSSLERGAKRLGVSSKIRTHTLRHIFCTSLLKRGVPIQIVSRLMRHASVTLTDSVYSHYQIDDLSLALNSRHPLIVSGLSVVEVFNTFFKTLNSLELSKDKRFRYELKRSKKELRVKLSMI